MKRIVSVSVSVFVFLLVLSSCDSFIGKKKSEMLKKQYESQVYLTLQNVTAGGQSLPKGTAIKIRIRTDKDWIKVYGYPASADELQSKQVLVMYLFKEDFEKEKFNEDIFKTQLFMRIQKAEETKR